MTEKTSLQAKRCGVEEEKYLRSTAADSVVDGGQGLENDRSRELVIHYRSKMDATR